MNTDRQAENGKHTELLNGCDTVLLALGLGKGKSNQTQPALPHSPSGVGLFVEEGVPNAQHWKCQLLVIALASVIFDHGLHNAPFIASAVTVVGKQWWNEMSALAVRYISPSACLMNDGGMDACS